jgi:predicted phage terminase large subunit-like protein
MTRLAPVHIVVILATRWHTDDIIGRILQKMSAEPEYPRFEMLKFPAKADTYPSGYLFPERYGPEWYSAQFASLGTYASSALLQCDPVPRGGNLLKTDKVVVEDRLPEDLRFVRFWDLASTVKERVKDEPDYTVGTKLAVKRIDNIDHIYVADVRRTREEAPARNALIAQTAKLDGQGVTVGIESVAGYKDTYTLMKDLLGGHSRVVECKVSSDKLVRAAPLEPVFEAGNVHILKAEWNTAWIDELVAFPSGRHDDQVDSLSGGYELVRQPCEFKIETASMFDASRYY